MTNTVWPVNAVTGAPSYSGKMLRQTMAAAYAGATAARPLGARSGVRPGTPTSTVTATSTVWTVNPHAGILDLQTSAAAGPYAYAIDAAVTGAVTAANATNPRKDIVYVKLDDPAEGDGSSVPAVTPLYLAGTAAAVPVAPATPARSMVLGVVNVPVSGGGSPTVQWTAPYLASAGGTVIVWSQTERDALEAYDGLEVYRLDTHRAERYNNGTWHTEQFIDAGYSGAATNASGYVTVSHNLGVAPTAFFASLATTGSTVGQQQIAKILPSSSNSATLTFLATRSDTSAVLASQTIGFYWQAIA